MEMMDMGKKMGELTAQPVGENKGKIMYPSFHLDKAPKEIMDKDIGHMCRIEILAKVVSKNETDEGQSAQLEIHKMGYISPVGGKSKDEYLDMPKEDREKYSEEEVMSRDDEEKKEDNE